MSSSIKTADKSLEPQLDQALTNHCGSHSLFSLATILSLIYLFGIGAAIRSLPVSAFAFIYWPLIKLAKECTPFSHFLAWYMFDVWKCTIPISI